jgi:hypothetical protein
VKCEDQFDHPATTGHKKASSNIMLLQRLDMNSDPNMSSLRNEFDSSKYPYENEFKRNTNASISPLVGPFASSTDNRTIPALPNLTAPSSSTSWSSTSASGVYSLFSTSASSSSLLDKNPNQNPHSYPFVASTKTQQQPPQQQPQPQNHRMHHVNVLQNNNSNYHGGMHPGNMEMLNHNAQMQAMPRSTDPLESVLGPFPCVRIRGLPFDTSLEDILIFFHGLVVLDVVFPQAYVQHGAGGEAFVVFGNPIDFQMALQR